MSTFKKFDTAESSFSGPPRSAAAPYSIFIRTLTGAAKPLTVQADDTILTVKEKIFDLFGNSPATQTLMYRGKTLMDSKTLAECNIGKESIVMLISRNQEKKEAPEVAPPKPRKEPKRKIGLAKKKETRNEAPAPPPPKIFILNEEKATPVTRIVAFTAYVFVQVSRQVNARFIAPTKETLFYLYSKIGRVLSLLIRYCLYIPLDKFYFSGGPIIISILDACGAFLYRLRSILRWCGAQISTGSTWCYEMSIRPTFNVICNIIKSIARNVASVVNWFSRQIVSVSNGTYRAISWTTNKLATTVRWIVNRLASILNWFANQFRLGMDCLANVISTCYRFVARICSATYNAVSNSTNWCFSKITAAFGHLIRMFQFIGEQTIRISTTLFNNCVYNPSHFVFTNVFHMFSNLGRFVWRQLLVVCSFSNTYVLTPLENGVSSFFQCLHRGVQSFFRAIEQGLITSSQSFERVQDFTSALFDFLVTRPCTSLYNALKYSIRTVSNGVSRSISNLFTQTMDFIVWFIGGVFEHSIIPLFTSGIIFAEDIVDLVLSTERLTMDILLYFYNSFKTLGNVTYRYTLVPISRWCQTAASTIYRTTKNLFSFIYRSVLVPIGNAIMTTMKTVWRFVKSNIIAFFRVFKNISSSVCSFVYRHLVSFFNSCWSGICWTYRHTVIPVGNTIKYFCTKFNAFVVHFARMIQSFLTHSASALYRGTCTTLRHTRVFCSNQLSTLARPFRASGTFLWQWAIYPSWTFFLHYLLLPYGRTVDYVAEFLWNKTRAAGSWCYSRTAAIGNSISGGLNRFLVQPLKNTYIVKTLLWVIYGEQRFIQKGLYGMDIRPAVMVKGIDTSYSLRHNQEFAVWIKNFSDELSLCTLSIGEKEIGKFKLAPTKSYLIEHSGDFVRFKFNAEIPNMTVVASFAPLSNQYPSRPVPVPNRGQTTSQTSNLEPEQKQELSGQPSWNDVMNGNVDNDIPTVEQVDSMSFDIGRGATQAFHVTTQRIQLDDSRVETISVPLRVLEV